MTVHERDRWTRTGGGRDIGTRLFFAHAMVHDGAEAVCERTGGRGEEGRGTPLRVRHGQNGYIYTYRRSSERTHRLDVVMQHAHEVARRAPAGAAAAARAAAHADRLSQQRAVGAAAGRPAARVVRPSRVCGCSEASDPFVACDAAVCGARRATSPPVDADVEHLRFTTLCYITSHCIHYLSTPRSSVSAWRPTIA